MGGDGGGEAPRSGLPHLITTEDTGDTEESGEASRATYFWLTGLWAPGVID
jgi:hypothetical protein